MGPTALVSASPDAEPVYARARRLLVESTLVAGDSEDPSQAQVEDGRLLTTAIVYGVPQVVYTTQLSGGVNAVGTLSSRSGRRSLLLMNTGATTEYVRFGATDPTTSDLSLAPGEKLPMNIDAGTEVRVVATTGPWSMVAIEGASS